MNSVLVKVLGVVLCVFAIIYFGYQAYMFTYDPYKTMVASLYNYTDRIEIDGIAIKDELLVENSSASGIVKYSGGSSQKVVAGMSVATVYANDADIETQTRIDKKTQLLNVLTSIESNKANISTNTQNVVKGIKDQQMSFVTAIDNNQYAGIESVESSFLEQMLKQQLVLNPETSYQEKIDVLNQEIDTLKGQMSAEGASIGSEQSGYFTRSIDGFESTITKENITDLSLDTVNGWLEKDLTAEAKASSATNVGKIITSSEWYFLATFNTLDADRIQEEDVVTLRFPNNTGYAISAVIEKISFLEDEEKSVVLLKSSNMNDGVVDVRKEHASVIFDTDKGIYVPKNAIRILDIEEEKEDGTKEKISQPGVYINMGQVVKFKKIDIQYETDEYVISAEHNEENDYLQLYDDIILEGDDLYDNKPIR